MKLKIIFYCIVIGIYGCKQSASKKVVDLHPIRFDHEIQKIDTNKILDGVASLKAKYGAFMDLYLIELLGIDIQTDSAKKIERGLKHFLTYKDYVNLQKTVNQKFPSTKKYDDELGALVGQIQQHWKDYKTPRLLYFTSGLNRYNAITFDTIIGVGLDMYLGADYEFYPAVQLNNYEIRKCTPENITVNAAYNIYESRYPFHAEDKNLLELLIERGKEFYFVDKVLPDKDLALKLGYTQSQLDWIKKNEKKVWNYFVSQNLLYSKEITKIASYVLDGPFTPNMPEQSPGNVGNYIGWQIVKRYADRKNLSVADVCSLNRNPQVILQDSKYKP